ncbi:MAG: hypothetical protein IT534_10525 [Bauldia sp.]|jgi:hypothetical protein|nr:hypothetical protein [Bauldia sp.]
MMIAIWEMVFMERRMQSSDRSRGAAAACAVAAIATLLSVAPASAGHWVPGGTYDIDRAVVVSFLRFLAEDGEGQMNIRCDALDGLTVDVGVAGNATLPPGTAVGDDVPATITFFGASPGTVVATGAVLVRQDGAVVVALGRDAAAPLAPLFLAAPEGLEITIAGTTRPVPMADIAERIVTFADHCQGWPR